MSPDPAAALRKRADQLDAEIAEHEEALTVQIRTGARPKPSRTVIVTADGSAFKRAGDPAAFRSSLPPAWQRLIVGPVQSFINDYVTWAFLPDGSYEGWEESDDGDRYRQQFTDLFTFAYEDGSTPFDVLVIDARFGGDEPGAGDEPQLIATLNPHVTASAGQHRGEGQQA